MIQTTAERTFGLCAGGFKLLVAHLLGTPREGGGLHAAVAPDGYVGATQAMESGSLTESLCWDFFLHLSGGTASVLLRFVQ